MHTFGSIYAIRHYSLSQTYYQILNIPLHASLKDIKTQFRKLLKQYHPDLNSHLTPEEKDANSKKYTEMVLAYDTLKDVTRRREYDARIGRRHPSTSGGSSFRRLSEWRSRNYSEPRSHSRRSSGSYTASGYNYTRHRVNNFYSGEAPSGEQHFDGRHTNRGDRYDVPHFNYDEHLAKQLKFEQRLIKKELSQKDLDQVLRQLVPDGDMSKVSDELLTKHLMRQKRCKDAFSESARSSHRPESHQYMYQGPKGSQQQDSGSSTFKTLAVLGGAGSMYIFYKCFAG